MKALSSFVLVDIIEEKVEGIIEYSLDNAFSKATVLSVGEDVKSISENDIVYFAKDCLKLKMDETKYIVDSKYIVAKD